VAKRAGAVAFIPDYRLAPENPFPAAVIDAESCYGGLLQHAARIAVVGDSAGGGLGLVLLSQVAQRGGIAPVAGVVLSPTTDLSLCSSSWETRSSADAYFTRSQASALVQSYLGTADPRDPRASALFGTLAGLPPIRVNVGEDEMLLDDAIRYVERAAAAGVDARVHVWEGMLHVFPSSIGVLRAADEALEQIGVFLADRLHRGA